MFSTAPFFCDYVVNYLMKDPQLGKTPAERKKYLYSGGLTIRTTIDLDMQAAADASVRKHVFARDTAIGGLAGVEPRTGNVKFLAQSRPMGRDKQAGQTYLNYVVPEKYGDSQGFQAGSTFKVFVLAAAIEKGIPLSETISSPEHLTLEKSDYKDCNGLPYSYGPWEVSNSTTSGTKDMYTGTRESVNTFYAQLEMKTGLCKPYRLAKAMGIELTSPGGDSEGNGAERVASFVLGVPSTSPLEMAEAYATFAGRGLHCPSRPVTAVEDSDGNQIREYTPNCRQVMAGPTADAVNDILRGVQEPGGFGHGAGINLAQVSAGKTGTINENRAVWFVGYTPNLATASMIAGADINGNWVTLNGQTLGRRLHRLGLRLDHGRPDVGRRDEGHRGRAARRGLRPAARRGPDGRPDHGAGPRRAHRRGGPDPARGARLRRHRVGLRRLLLRGRHGRLHLPRGGRDPGQRRHRRDLPVRRLPAAQAARQGQRRRRWRRHGGSGGGNGGGRGHTARTLARPGARPRRWSAPGAYRAQPSWRRTSAATADPSARPLTWGWTTPITLPIARIPSPAAPVCSMAAETIATTSASESGSGR